MLLKFFSSIKSQHKMLKGVKIPYPKIWKVSLIKIYIYLSVIFTHFLSVNKGEDVLWLIKTLNGEWKK